MKKTILVFGCIAGLIVSTFMFVSMLFYKNNPSFEGSMLIGYASMLIAFAFIFVGIKSFRDKHHNGTITFGKAFLIGLFISLIASTFYVITWVLEFNFIFPNFMELYAENMINQAKASGVSQIELDKQIAEMERYKALYKNPLFMVLLTYMEILPVGILVTIISALILKRRERTLTV
jgi:amino acid transporter